MAEAQRLAREWKPKQEPEKKQPQKPKLALPVKKPVTVLAPHWGRLKTLPAARQDKTPLKPNEVFRLVNPSVWVVYAAQSVEELRSRKGKIAQGSAVAISTSRLVTNCHIVSKRPTVFILREKQVLNARLVSSDIATDRCILETQNGQLRPVPGIRSFGELEIGERVYTVGAPRGLENTLGDGIVSGLRKWDGVALVQTTAPISPGSSGGGLFDERGNLIGVTTLYLRESDALNFAIAASEYWR